MTRNDMTRNDPPPVTAQGPATRRVLAIVADGEPDVTIIGVAEALAAISAGCVRLVPIIGGTPVRDAEARAVAELDAGDGRSVLVVGRDAPLPSLWRSLARHVQVPVVVVPSGRRTSPVALKRLLIPLDGSAETAATVAESAEWFARSGGDLIVLHVFDETTAPRFWDQAAHAPQAWEQEFLARFVARPGVRLELRHGRPGEHVLNVASTERVDLIALGWSRDLSPGRAHTVRETVRYATVPVMLLPVALQIGPGGWQVGGASR